MNNAGMEFRVPLSFVGRKSNWKAWENGWLSPSLASAVYLLSKSAKTKEQMATTRSQNMFVFPKFLPNRIPEPSNKEVRLATTQGICNSVGKDSFI